ncbi:hypothetical protein [Lignipirellula cremea]|uniref:Uncharacterized protein n=1 Tax=Lignipirellula cremea TaxID=2528010 RepID=A0A518DPA8_9BACT|nr:hypothetical protein [Lignipirellula cremea]QDU93643.1 hypothetical protein Pla8534_14230 [Lignipirellula cremea]
MTSHFSAIGLPVESEEDFLALANRVAEDSEQIDVPGGSYLRWSSDSGAEIWLQLDGAEDLIGMTPHFAGESCMRAGITAPVERPDATLLDGAFLAWSDPSGDAPEAGKYPFVFDSPDARQYPALTIPSIVSVQIAAFAHEVSIFETVEAYDASQTGELKFASKSFIPSGMFAPDGDATEPPQAFGIFTGHIIRAAKKQNELSGHSFYWALVETLGGHFDVVIDPELVEQEPKAGGVLTGFFWLSGRILPE